MADYTLLSSVSAGNRVAAPNGALQLSDGTLVFVAFDPSLGKTNLYYTVDRSTINLIETVPSGSAGNFVAASGGNVAICRDANDNLYIISKAFSDNKLAWRFYAKGAGYTWTPSAITSVGAGSTAQPSTLVGVVWCNTGGGTNVKGHLLVVGWETSLNAPFTMVLDAGLVQTNTVANVITDATGAVAFWNLAGNSAYGDIAQNGHGAAAGMTCYVVDSTAMHTGKWSISAAGGLTQSEVTGGSYSLGSNFSTRPRILRYAPDRYLVAYYNNSVSTKIYFGVTASTGTILTGRTWTAPTGISTANWSGPKWDIVLDIATGKVLFYFQHNSDLKKLGIALSDAAITFDVATTTERAGIMNAATDGSQQIRTAKDPTIPRVDWQFSFADALSGPLYKLVGGDTNLAPTVPTAVLPSAGSTVTTDVPTLSATLAAFPVNTKAEWQIASDAAFTTNLRTITEADTDLRGSGTTTEDVPVGLQLYQGTWYVRARALTQTAVSSAWSAAQSFTVAHAPTTTGHVPSSSAYGLFGATTHLQYVFADSSPVDFQTARQIIVERNSDGLVLVDTGKVATAAQDYDAAISGTYKDVLLRWKVRPWDSDDVVGAYSPYQTFYVGDAPTVTVTGPAEGSTVATAAPTITWTFGTGGGGRTQAKRRVEIIRVMDGATVYDTLLQASTTGTHAVPTPVLSNNLQYDVRVTVEDTGGLQRTDTNRFTASWVAPATPDFTVDASSYAEDGYVRIAWTNAVKDPEWIAWRVYRRNILNATPGGLWLPGLASQYAGTPDNAKYTPSASQMLDLRVLASPNDWTNPTIQTLMAHYGGSTNRSFIFRIDTIGRLQFLYSLDGSTLQTTATAPTAPVNTFANGVAYWLRVTRHSGTGEIKFYWALDEPVVNWQEYHTVAGTAGALFNTTTLLSIGAYGSAQASEPFKGRILKAEIIVGGGSDANPDFTDATVWQVGDNLVTRTDSQGNAWTLNGADAHIVAQSDEPWDLVAERLDDVASYTFDDYLMGSGEPHEYAVVQVASRFGALVESG